MEESPTIYDIPEPCQIWTRIWTSLGHGVQLISRTSFGRSNLDRLRNSYIYHPSKFQLDPTVQTLGTFRLVHHFSDLFSARKRIRPEFIFFMNGISDILLKEVLYGVLCFVPEHIPLTVRSFEHDLQHHAGVKPARQYYSTAADLC